LKIISYNTNKCKKKLYNNISSNKFEYVQIGVVLVGHYPHNFLEGFSDRAHENEIQNVQSADVRTNALKSQRVIKRFKFLQKFHDMRILGQQTKTVVIV